jgi:outer membrane protein OmpA-like peptidoglycan-associated protein
VPRLVAYLGLLLLLLSSASSVLAQGATSLGEFQDSVYYTPVITHPNPLSLFLGGAADFHIVKDGLLPPPLSTNCDAFLNGKGIQPLLQLGLDIPLDTERKFQLRPTLFYEGLGADHTWAEYDSVVSEIVNGQRHYRVAEFNHTITNYTKAIGLGALLNWQVVPHFSIGVGFSAAALFDQTYIKIERAVSSGDLIRVGGDSVREKIDTSGSLPNARSFYAALHLRAALDVPLSKQLRAEPNVSFSMPLVEAVPYWSHYSLRGGIDLVYELPSIPDTVLSEHHIKVWHDKPPEIKKPVFTAHIEAAALGSDGKEEPVATLEVREVKARNAYPMLNYIFFDSASSEIAPRYVQYKVAEEATRSFKGSIERRGERTSDLYLETLNILGDRLRRQPTATVRLVGSNSGSDEGSAELARRRAETIKNYLHRIWGIDDKRMTISGSVLPEKPSPNTIAEGQAENRRVEIIPSDISITDPLYVTNIERTANPPKLNINLSFDPEETVRSYRASFKIANIEVSSFEGDSLTATRSTRWSVPEEALTTNADSLSIDLVARDKHNEIAYTHTAIKLAQQHNTSNEEQKIDRFSLILFGFDESSLGAKNERTLGIVAEALRKIKPRSITISGYTDELGDENHNNELSHQRAETAAAMLERELRKRNIPVPPTIMIEGLGSKGHLYDNKLPEGRFFSRTVMITIER